MKKYAVEPQIPRAGLSTVWQRFFYQILNNRYLYHNILILGTNVLAGIFAYLLHPFLGRMLGIEEYGQVAALISFSLVLTTPTQIISTVAAKYASSMFTSEDRSKLNDFIRRLTPILLAAGCVVTAIFVAASGYMASFFHFSSPQSVVLLGLIFIVSFVTPLNLGTIQGLQYFGWFATITLLSAFLRLALAIGFVLIGLGVNGAVLGIVISLMLTYLVSLQPLWKILRGLRMPAGSLRSLWLYSILASGVTLGIVVLFSLDTVLTRHFLSASDAGLYAALATIGRTVLLITTGITTVMFPRIVMLHEKGEPHTHIAIQAILGTMLLASMVEVMFYLAPSLITKILFGQAFIAVSSQLAFYGLAMLLLAIGVVIINYFLAIGNRPFVFIVFLACILQTSLIAWHHASIAEVVQTVLTTNVALVLALLLAFSLSAMKSVVGAKKALQNSREEAK